jgi:hypothetical protein
LFGVPTLFRGKERQDHWSSSMAYETEIWIPHINHRMTDNKSVLSQMGGEISGTNWLCRHCQIQICMHWETVLSFRDLSLFLHHPMISLIHRHCHHRHCLLHGQVEMDE